MNAKAHSARNGPRWFTTAIAIAGAFVGLASATASPPVNEAVSVPKNGINATSQIRQNDSPGATVVAGANQQVSQFDVADYSSGGDANLNPLDKLASNNGVTDVVAVSNEKAEFYTGNSDTAYNVATAVTSIAPLDTSPPATVGRFLAAVFGHARVNPEGGAGYGARLAANFAAGSSVWTEHGDQATACTV